MECFFGVTSAIGEESGVTAFPSLFAGCLLLTDSLTLNNPLNLVVSQISHMRRGEIILPIPPGYSEI